MYRKLFGSIGFFRRSFARSSDQWTAIVSLAIAFEMLLTDIFSSGVRARVVRRTRILLKGTRGIRKMTRAVELLYAARGDIVHTGERAGEVPLREARRAFVHAFVSLVGRLRHLSTSSSAPLGDLCGD